MVSCEMSCDVMWCLVMSFDVMGVFVGCHVTCWNVMSCDVFSCDEMSPDVK